MSKKKHDKMFRKKIEKMISGAFITVVSLSLFFALIMFDSKDSPLFLNAYNDSEQGIFKSYMDIAAQYLFHSIGYTSYITAIFLAIAGVVIFLDKNLKTLIKPTLFLCMTGVFLPLVIALTVDIGSDATLTELTITYGGMLGVKIMQHMVTSFGKIGTYLFSVGAVLISLVLTTNIRPSALVELLISSLESILKTTDKVPSNKKKNIKRITQDITSESKPEKEKDNISLLTAQELDAISKAFEKHNENHSSEENTFSK